MQSNPPEGQLDYLGMLEALHYRIAGRSMWMVPTDGITEYDAMKLVNWSDYTYEADNCRITATGGEYHFVFTADGVPQHQIVSRVVGVRALRAIYCDRIVAARVPWRRRPIL